MSSSSLRTAVLISGTGSNLKTLIDANGSGKLDLEFCRVISNRRDAGGLAHAAAAGIPSLVIDESDAAEQDRRITASLLESRAELVVLAGYMRILGDSPVEAFAGRMINLHPSLLPRYPGLHTYRRALEAGDRVHGASIHFVTGVLDGGPVISQVQIPVRDGDTERDLAARLGPREHALLRATVELFSQGRVELTDAGVRVDGHVRTTPLLLNDDDELG